MKKESLVIWGASGHAMVAADIIRLGQQFEISGYLDDVDRTRRGEPFYGSTVRGGGEELAALWSEGIHWLFIAVGDCDARLKIAMQVREHGFRLATLYHPRAIVAADAKVGEGTLIAAGAVLGPGAIIGNQVIINTAATVDHECIVEDGVHVCPGAHLAGCVRVGRGAWIGLGTNVKDEVQIGAHSIVGAGSLVLKDIPEGVVAYGVPAKVVSPRPNYEEKPS